MGERILVCEATPLLMAEHIFDATLSTLPSTVSTGKSISTHNPCLLPVLSTLSQLSLHLFHRQSLRHPFTLSLVECPRRDLIWAVVFAVGVYPPHDPDYEEP